MKYNNEVTNAVIQLSKKGVSSRKIAKLLGISSKSTVNNILYKHNELTSDKAIGQPTITYLDIETAPCIAAVFGRFGINLSQDNIIENGGQIISACWQVEGSEEVKGVVMTSTEARERDDSRIVATLYDVIESSDILVWQNGDKFDSGKIKTRLIVNGFPPPKTVKTVDTLKIARQLGFPSNRLDALGDYLKVGRKEKHSGIGLWIRCLSGDTEALQEMLVYNKQDVSLLRDVYLKLRAFDQRHPNVALYYQDDATRCAVCGSENVSHTGNSVFTEVSEFKEVQCNDCGHRHRTRKAINTKEKRDSLVVNTK